MSFFTSLSVQSSRWTPLDMNAKGLWEKNGRSSNSSILKDTVKKGGPRVWGEQTGLESVGERSRN